MPFPFFVVLCGYYPIHRREPRDETRIPLHRASPFAKATEDKTEDKLICANGFMVSVPFVISNLQQAELRY